MTRVRCAVLPELMEADAARSFLHLVVVARPCSEYTSVGYTDWRPLHYLFGDLNCLLALLRIENDTDDYLSQKKR
jgi:hypothetical protein